MPVSARSEAGTTVVAVAGSVDASVAADVQRRILDALPLGAPPPAGQSAVLDLTRVDHLSSAGLRVLLVVHRRAEAAGLRLALTGLSPLVRETLTATGFLRFFAEADGPSQERDA